MKLKRGLLIIAFGLIGATSSFGGDWYKQLNWPQSYFSWSEVTSGFGPREWPTTWFHSGLDFSYGAAGFNVIWPPYPEQPITTMVVQVKRIGGNLGAKYIQLETLKDIHEVKEALYFHIEPGSVQAGNQYAGGVGLGTAYIQSPNQSNYTPHLHVSVYADKIDLAANREMRDSKNPYRYMPYYTNDCANNRYTNLSEMTPTVTISSSRSANCGVARSSIRSN
ncbi:MAG TPA: hypothetical protein VJ385_23265 [Fibrobacteria bacterium]|nr:hypothetical protein [Fibrobacteria bacterium]